MLDEGPIVDMKTTKLSGHNVNEPHWYHSGTALCLHARIHFLLPRPPSCHPQTAADILIYTRGPLELPCVLLIGFRIRSRSDPGYTQCQIKSDRKDLLLQSYSLHLGHSTSTYARVTYSFQGKAELDTTRYRKGRVWSSRNKHFD